MSIELHHRLDEDCHNLGLTGDCQLLLSKNATVPWFILVPDTLHNEIYKMPAKQQQAVNHDIARVAAFVEEFFETDKLNIATIGNIVPQLHIHIIGRYTSDLWWPEPVWGQAGIQAYTEEQLDNIRQGLAARQLLG